MAQSLVDSDRGSPRPSHGEEATPCCPNSQTRRSDQLKAALSKSTSHRDVESCLTKDLLRVRSLMKKKISDEVHLQVCHLTPQQVRSVQRESTQPKTDEISAVTMIVEETNTAYKKTSDHSLSTAMNFVETSMIRSFLLAANFFTTTQCLLRLRPPSFPHFTTVCAPQSWDLQMHSL